MPSITVAGVADWLILACVALLAAAYLLEVRRRWRPRRAELDRLVARRRVIVNTTTGQSFDGVLTDCGDDWLVLRAVKLLEPRGPTPVDGEVWLEVRKVDFVQALSPAAD